MDKMLMLKCSQSTASQEKTTILARKATLWMKKRVNNNFTDKRLAKSALFLTVTLHLYLVGMLLPASSAHLDAQYAQCVEHPTMIS